MPARERRHGAGLQRPQPRPSGGVCDCGQSIPYCGVVAHCQSARRNSCGRRTAREHRTTAVIDGSAESLLLLPGPRRWVRRTGRCHLVDSQPYETKNATRDVTACRGQCGVEGIVVDKQERGAAPLHRTSRRRLPFSDGYACRANRIGSRATRPGPGPNGSSTSTAIRMFFPLSNVANRYRKLCRARRLHALKTHARHGRRPETAQGYESRGCAHC